MDNEQCSHVWDNGRECLHTSAYTVQSGPEEAVRVCGRHLTQAVMLASDPSRPDVTVIPDFYI